MSNPPWKRLEQIDSSWVRDNAMMRWSYKSTWSFPVDHDVVYCMRGLDHGLVWVEKDTFVPVSDVFVRDPSANVMIQIIGGGAFGEADIVYPTHQTRTPEAKQSVCRCDLIQLMNVGHDDKCPEK